MRDFVTISLSPCAPFFQVRSRFANLEPEKMTAPKPQSPAKDEIDPSKQPESTAEVVSVPVVGAAAASTTAAAAGGSRRRSLSRGRVPKNVEETKEVVAPAEAVREGERPRPRSSSRRRFASRSPPPASSEGSAKVKSRSRSPLSGEKMGQVSPILR